MITIIAATEFEIKALMEHYNTSNEIDFIITGYGIVNTIFHTQKYLYENKNRIKENIFINTGIAGGFTGTKLSDLCLCNVEVLADFGKCFSKKIEYFSNMKPIIIKNKFNDFLKKRFQFDQAGTFLTVNCVTVEKPREIFFMKKFSPIVENMEGYATAFLAEKFQLNYSEIRVISNYIGDRQNWQTEVAVKKLNNFLITVIERLKREWF